MTGKELRIGFIGLGAMGHSLAGHLHAHGLLAVVGNRSAARATDFAAAHSPVRVAASPADFAACNVVVLCVSADADVLENVTALAAVLAPGALVV
ncbi:MAG: NAD(P)-binding domain-containing protein, partial [Arenimonas sp.]